MPSCDVPFTCRGCSLLCDDLFIDESGRPFRNSVASSSPAEVCLCAEKWLNFGDAQGAVSSPPADTRDELRAQLAECRSLLKNAQRPLFCGLQGLTLEAEAAALELARQHRAFVSLGLDPSQITAGQRYGGASCSFGEIQQRCDLVVCCDVDALLAWERFEERFLTPAGRFRQGRQDRCCLFFGQAETFNETANRSSRYDEHLMVPAGQYAEAVSYLRYFVQQLAPPAKQASDQVPELSASSDSRLPAETRQKIEDLARRLLQAEYPVLLTGKEASLEFAWAQLVHAINLQGRVHRLSVSAGPAWGKPAESLLMHTGFPDAVRLQGEQTVHDDLLFQPDQLLADQQCDLIFWLGSTVPERWADWLQRIPKHLPLIILKENGPGPAIPEHARVLQAERAGVEFPGTFVRADGLPLPLHVIRPANSLDMTGCLQELLTQATT